MAFRNNRFRQAALLTACVATVTWCGRAVGDNEDNSPEIPTAGAGLVFDWVSIENTFYLEVKNISQDVFTLEETFVDRINIWIVGLNSNLEEIYRTPDDSDICGCFERDLIDIAPGNFHRTEYRLAFSLRGVPDEVRYIRFRWTANGRGTRLSQTLETNIYELKDDAM